MSAIDKLKVNVAIANKDTIETEINNAVTALRKLATALENMDVEVTELDAGQESAEMAL